MREKFCPVPYSTPEPEATQLTRVVKNSVPSPEGSVEFKGSTLDAAFSHCTLGPNTSTEGGFSAYDMQETIKNPQNFSHLNRERIERQVLCCDILESLPHVLKQVTQYLKAIGLIVLGDHNSRAALELLAKDQADLLQVFEDCRTEPYKALPGPTASGQTFSGAELHQISLLRSLLEHSDLMVDPRPQRAHPGYQFSDNAKLCSSIVGVTDANQFDFGPGHIHDALLKLKLLGRDFGVRPLDWVTRGQRIATVLMGYPKGFLDIPSQLLRELSLQEIELFCKYLRDMYDQYPSLETSKNNILLLLSWTSRGDDRSVEVIRAWANSDDALKLSRRMKEDFQHPQGAEQLALTLDALLCHDRLLPHRRADTTYPIKGCYLTDLHVMLGEDPTDHDRAVLERMESSLRRISDTCEGHARVSGLLTVTTTPLLHLHDGYTDQYMIRRSNRKLSHADVMEEIGLLRLMVPCLSNARW